MKSKTIITAAMLVWSIAGSAQSVMQQFNFDAPLPLYSEEKGYGYDLQAAPAKMGKQAFFFSVQVPDGNYRVTVKLGSKKQAGSTTVRGESRRLFIENFPTKKGELVTRTFVINKRSPQISATESVKIKAREKHKLNWDDKLTLEFNGSSPCVSSMSIERVDTIPTVFLCGNSTVVDQDNEPWASWGQMIPRFLDENVCIANYAESGESANTFFAAGRVKKALTHMKPGDYLFMEFGHNDQKQKGPGKGAFYSFMTSLKIFIDEARERGVQPVLVTPTCRRSFDANGKIIATHLDFPEAICFLATRENVPLIDLQEFTRTLYEALGNEGSKKAFVHYPIGSYPGQTVDLADNTHFNTYGAYQIAKCVIEGIKTAGLPLVAHIAADYKTYSPTTPDAFDSFHWNESPFTEIEKPDGN